MVNKFRETYCCYYTSGVLGVGHFWYVISEYVTDRLYRDVKCIVSVIQRVLQERCHSVTSSEWHSTTQPYLPYPTLLLLFTALIS